MPQTFYGHNVLYSKARKLKIVFFCAIAVLEYMTGARADGGHCLTSWVMTAMLLLLLLPPPPPSSATQQRKQHQIPTRPVITMRLCDQTQTLEM
jgi:hypothetical protein